MKLSTLILAALLAAGGPLHALTIALDPNIVTLSPGDSFTFSGIISNTGPATVDLNGIDVTLNGSLFQFDITPFFSGPLTVAAGTSTPTFALFSVTVDLPYNAPAGLQAGTLTILGGVEVNDVYDPTVQDFQGAATFSINVASVPEPSSFAMMTPALLAGIGFLTYHRKKRKGGHASANVSEP